MKKKKTILFIYLILFIIVMFLVIFNFTSSIDNFVYKIVTIWKNDNITKIMKSLTFLGSTPFMVSLSVITLIITYFIKRAFKGLLGVCLLINSTIVNNVVKIIIRRPRPEFMIIVENTYSFPSGHMMAATTVYGFLIYFFINQKMRKSIKIPCIIIFTMLMITVGITRMYLGAHYFTDIFSAYLLSSSLILIYDIYLEPKFNVIRKKDKKTT